MTPYHLSRDLTDSSSKWSKTDIVGLVAVLLAVPCAIAAFVTIWHCFRTRKQESGGSDDTDIQARQRNTPSQQQGTELQAYDALAGRTKRGSVATSHHDTGTERQDQQDETEHTQSNCCVV